MLPKGRNPKGSIPPAEFAALESSVRGLMVGGKFKTALDRAKDAHRIYGTPASEALLIDAYMARIQSLTQTGLVREAASLLNLVRERFPAARNRLSLLDAENQARSGSLDELLAPLNDPTLSPERVTIIERVIQERIYDPGMLASCGVLQRNIGCVRQRRRCKGPSRRLRRGRLLMRCCRCRRYPAAARWHRGKCWCGRWRRCTAATPKLVADTWRRSLRTLLPPASYRLLKRIKAIRNPVRVSPRRRVSFWTACKAMSTF